MARIPPQNKPRQWNPTAEPLENEDLTITFEGLFSICYLFGLNPAHPDYRKCQIGVFNRDPRHRFFIETSGGTCDGGINNYEYTQTQLRDLEREKFSIGIEGAGVYTDVAFLQVAEIFNRETSTDPSDFRWHVDVESPDLYNAPTTNQQPHYGPKILVKNGTFLTTRVNRNKFKFVERDPGDNINILGGVAAKTSARIKLAEGQTVLFSFKDPEGQAKSCRFTKGGFGNIRFKNLCFADGKRCSDPDFHLHFGTFDPPDGRKKFDLNLDRSLLMSPGPLEEVDVKDSSDEAPCHSMGYGMSGTGTPPD